jgi:hypothetical protein
MRQTRHAGSSEPLFPRANTQSRRGSRSPEARSGPRTRSQYRNRSPRSRGSEASLLSSNRCAGRSNGSPPASAQARPADVVSDGNYGSLFQTLAEQRARSATRRPTLECDDDYDDPRTKGRNNSDYDDPRATRRRASQAGIGVSVSGSGARMERRILRLEERVGAIEREGAADRALSVEIQRDMDVWGLTEDKWTGKKG